MTRKLVRTLLFAAAIGFLVVWILEYRRAGMLNSYWLLLLSVTSLLLFQFSRLKTGIEAQKDITSKQTSRPTARKTTRK
ncbi:hypothetical protein DYBT9275_03409 [Dyadobacter sp. CECT 9275]|uniref:Uncharacterized protein n=1 Tax=Dyadobacter helix TaxID=2822344 RepID=A0A916JCL4_9BACT|nr:hypothetical protein [Dyadobacter sp. CECT 9275]CAG5004627.1 hypothetical protein DYBT9275_03409 [Dyadobacter sp. CECT 9275]